MVRAALGRSLCRRRRRAPGAGGGTIDLLLWLQHLALDVASRALFSRPLGEQAQRLRRLLVTYGSRYGTLGFLDFFMPLWLPNPRDVGRWWFKRRWFALIDAMIERRRRQEPEEGRQDLFDLLVAARHPETRAPFGADKLRDQVATMLVAGHETTAVALFWACYLLARSQHWQERVASEAAVCDLGPDGASAALAHLPITRAVIEEAMRLYPPVYVIVRQAIGPDRLADRSIEPGTIIMAAPWVLHRHRRLWPDPDAFDPSRFMAEVPPSRFGYLPFGVGPRVCIGAPLALTEATIVLASLMQRFRIELVHRRPVLPVAVVTTQPDHAVPFLLTPR